MGSTTTTTTNQSHSVPTPSINSLLTPHSPTHPHNSNNHQHAFLNRRRCRLRCFCCLFWRQLCSRQWIVRRHQRSVQRLIGHLFHHQLSQLRSLLRRFSWCFSQQCLGH